MRQGLVAICGFILALPGLIMSIIAYRSVKSGAALAGIICSSVGMLLAIANAALGLIIALNQQ